MKAKIRGCYPAIVTPFGKEGPRSAHPINYDALDMLVEHVIKGGVNGVVVAGCTGSASLLSHDEQVELVKHVQDNFGEKTTVIAGDGSNSTREAIGLAKRMEQEAGVFTHLSISPYYNKPSDRGMSWHYAAIANNIEGELIMYSVPGRTGGKGIMPDTAKELAGHPHIIGIKEASGDLSRIKKTIEKTKEHDFFVISGDDGLAYEIIRRGGVGLISVAANIAPKLMSHLVHYSLDDEEILAKPINRMLSDLYSALFPKSDYGNPSPNPVLCHYALRQIGIPVGVLRWPLCDAEQWEKQQMDKALDALRHSNKLDYYS